MFTQAGAWDFVGECLEDQGIQIYEILLDQPPNKRAWYFTVPGHDGAMIYIKIHFGPSNVVGRSFHISNDEK
jgi:hypothetical protein